MKKLKIYLDTSVLKFYYADDAPDKKNDTIILFEEIEAGKYEAFISDAVLAEINRADDRKKELLIKLINRFELDLAASDGIDELADIYVASGIIPEKYRDDAVHLAYATLCGMDIILSWNFKHIVKRKTIQMVNLVNSIEGYKNIDIYSPSEVIENDEDL